MRSAPRIVEIPPNETTQFIENLASKTYELAKLAGGSIPYTVIREVSENFIHAQFNEVVVSILDHGDTIRFADQGPGIAQKEKAQLPGFTSAIEPMKHYIRGVGSGLPIVRDYLDSSKGSIFIDDNIESGAVVTISLNPEALIEHQPDLSQSSLYPPQRDAVPTGLNATTQPTGETSAQSQPSDVLQPGQQPTGSTPSQRKTAVIPPLSKHGRVFLPLLLSEGELGVTELSNLSNVAISSTHATLKKLEETGLIKRVGKKRMLTEYGYEVARQL